MNNGTRIDPHGRARLLAAVGGAFRTFAITSLKKLHEETKLALASMKDEFAAIGRELREQLTDLFKGKGNAR